MGSIADKLNYLKETVEEIKTSIINKNPSVDNINTLRDCVQEINSLPILNTSDATATSNDIYKGKTAYINGQKVVGTLLPHKINFYANPVTDTLLLNLVGIFNGLEGTFSSSITYWRDNMASKNISLKNRTWNTTEKALTFNGTNTYFDTSVAQSVLEKGYTIITRIKPTEWGNWRGLWGLHSGGNWGINGFQWGSEAHADYAHCTNTGDTSILINPSEHLSLNQYHIIMVTYDGVSKEYSIYIDGKFLGSQIGAFTGNGNLIVGKAYEANDRFFKGNMSHFMIYNKPLAEDERNSVTNYINDTVS